MKISYLQLNLAPGLSKDERVSLAEKLTAAPDTVLLEDEVAPDEPRRNGLVRVGARVLMGRLTPDDRLCVYVPGLGQRTTEKPIEQGVTGWIFQPRKAPGAPVEAPSALTVETVVAWLRERARTAPKGASQMKAVATILTEGT